MNDRARYDGERVVVVEVGPRDGLQNEKGTISTGDKIAFVDMLTAAGLPVIEVSAFVSPRWVPQMADAEQVFGGITRAGGTRYTALVPNIAGLERAQKAGVTEVAIFAASSETFSRKNINQSIEESLVTYKQVCDGALSAGMKVRGYLSTAFGCPYEGNVPADTVATLSERLIDLGVFEVAVSDTIGIARPPDVSRVLDPLLARVPARRVALHFHDTRGQALANVEAALPFGIRTFDASAGGLGGCPYAPGAPGNLATGDLIQLLNELGIETGVSLDKLMQASTFVRSRLTRP
ncbi:MAG TPA: hydroxymethylglutaryl-CoA lyase [Vicinamibacterales bacterium]|nr:hydroxymethylglutaryl-CoA lyase [Vicinamibacterales bacterium]